MDIYLNAKIDLTKKVLTETGFTLKHKKNYYSATKNAKQGRYHLLLKHFKGTTYCDFHFDYKLHFLGFGVDYNLVPKAFFRDKLKKILDQRNITYKTEKVNWFTRRNKAILTGFKLQAAIYFLL